MSSPKSSPSYQIDWQADEYQQHPKDWRWLVGFIVIVSGLIVASYYLGQGDLVAPVVISLLALLMLVYSLQQPRKLDYTITNKGIKINRYFYGFNRFRAFSVSRTNDKPTLHLIPNQRFSIPLSIELPADRGQKIVRRLSKTLTYTSVNQHPVDQLMHYLRF